MKIVFIAGSLTSGWDGQDRDFIQNRIKAAEEYQIALINAGIGCFCPHAHTALHHEKGSQAPAEFYYELDREFLRRTADAVLAIPGWDKSKGAKREVALAKERSLPVFYPKSPEDIKNVVTWSRKND